MICGSRNWRDRARIRLLIAEFPYHAVVIHGAHWQGADKIADEEARQAGLRVEPYPALWDSFGPAAGPLRNAHMIAWGKPELVFAFRSKGVSDGTDDCVSRARKAGIPTFVIREGERAKIGEIWRQMSLL